MEHINRPDWEIKTRSIFVIIFERSKSFFLNDTTQKNLWKVYDEHYRERHSCTKKPFAESKNQNLLPPIFLLESIEGTSADAFQRCILWSKYFISKGYFCLTGEKIIDFVEKFDSDTDDFYQSIKDIPIEKICPEDKNLYPEFKQKKEKSLSQKELRRNSVRLELVIHKKEYENFKKTADEHGISMTEFFLYCARHGDIMCIDLSAINQYLRMIEDYSNTLDGIIATILLSREYFPTDLERMYELSHEVISSNSEVKKEIIRLCRKIRRINNW